MVSKRLSLVLQVVPNVGTIADVGTDHGYLAVSLIQEGKAKRVIATDVNEGPLVSAKAHVEEMGLEEMISCRLGDGLQTTVAGEVDLAIMCGMGGDLMQHIIEGGPELLDTYVLQPQSKRRELKRFLANLGYGVIEEFCLEEAGHYYDVWIVKKGQYKSSAYMNVPEESLLWEFGALLAQKRDPAWVAYIEKRIEEQKKISLHMRDHVKGPKLEAVERQLQQLEELLYGNC